MKRILLFILTLLPFVLQGQTQPPNATFNGKLYQYNKGLKVVGPFFGPRQDTATLNSDPSMLDAGMITWNPADGFFYGRNQFGWFKFTTGDGINIYNSDGSTPANQPRTLTIGGIVPGTARLNFRAQESGFSTFYIQDKNVIQLKNLSTFGGIVGSSSVQVDQSALFFNVNGDVTATATPNMRFFLTGSTGFGIQNNTLPPLGSSIFEAHPDRTIWFPGYPNTTGQILTTDAAGQVLLTPAPSVTGATVPTVNALMAYSGTSPTVIVSDSLRGGSFNYIAGPTPPSVDSGIIFPATGIGSGVWQRQWNRSAVSAAWFGCLPGMADASRGLNKAIETFAATGIAIYLPVGIYRLKDVIVKRNIRISADQITKSNILDNLTVKILPVIGTTTNVFRFEPTAVFSALEHLFIDGDYVNSPNLTAAVRMDGYSNLINDLTIVNTADCALSASAPLGGQYGLNSRLEHSSIHGMRAPFQPFTSFNDFHGAVQITGGDITITDNEFGANLPYLSINIPPVPADMLRDPVNSRIVAFCGDILVNAWVYNNFFENGDQGCVIKQGEHNTFYGNRYEMNGTRGLLLKIVQHSTFTGEKFGNNSLAINGNGEDIRLDTGGVAYCDFTNLNFKKFVDVVNIPTSYYKVKFNIVNYSGPGGNSMTSPTFSDTTAIVKYDSLGHYDNTIQSVPFRHLEGQTNYKAPTFDGLTVGGVGFRDPWTAVTSKGGLELQPGTTAGTGGFSGSLRFYNQAGTTTSSLGFDAFPGLTVSSAGNATFLTAGMIHAKTGGTNVNMISDNTGISTIQFSSDVVPTRSALMRFYNTNGDFTMSASRHMYFGLINNLEMNINGQNYLRNVPDAAGTDSTYGFLVRKNDGGQILLKPNVYWDSTKIKSYISALPSTGVTSLNTLTGGLTLATANSGAAPAFTTAGSTITLGLPDMAGSVVTQGLINNGTQSLPGAKNFTTSIQTAQGWSSGNFGVGTSATPSSARLYVISANTSGIYVQNSSAIGAATGGFIRALNAGTPSAADQRLGGIIGGTNPTGTTFRTGGSMEYFSDAAWTDGTSHPTSMRFFTVPTGTTTLFERMRIAATGLVTMNNGLTVAGATTLASVGVAGPSVLTGGLYLGNRTVAGSTAANVGDYAIYCNNTGANITISLPPAATASRIVYVIKKISNNAFTVSIDPDASETIEGSATPLVITTYLGSITLQCDGTQWWVN